MSFDVYEERSSTWQCVRLVYEGKTGFDLATEAAARRSDRLLQAAPPELAEISAQKAGSGARRGSQGRPLSRAGADR
jgi:hypothetical protein